MNKNYLRAFAAAAVITASSPASAACDGCVVSAVGAAASSIVGATTVQTGILANEIAGAAGSVSSMIIAGVGSSVIRSAEMIVEADGKTASRVHAAQTIYQTAITDPCAVVAVGRTGRIGEAAAAVAVSLPGGGGGGAGSLKKAGGAASSLFQAKATGMASAADVVLGSTALGASAPPSEQLVTAASQFGCSAFASGGRAASCQEAGGGSWAPAGTAQRPNGDVRAETLFDGPQGEANKSTKRLTIYGDLDELAVKALMRNLVDPIPLRDLKPAETRSDEGRRFLALKDTYTARINVATQGLRDQVADMMPDSETKSYLEGLVEQGEGLAPYRAYVTGHLSRIKNPDGTVHNWKALGVSPAEFRAIEANRRYRNPRWYTYLGQATEREQFIEMASMSATQIAMQVEMIEELRRMRVAVSMVAAGGVREEMRPVLTRQHAAATK